MSYSCFLRFENRTIKVELTDANISVLAFKQILHQHPDVGIPVAQQRLIRAGSLMQDTQQLSDFHLRNSTTLHLIRQRNEPGPEQPAPQAPPSGTDWERTPFVPLESFDHELPTLEGDIFETKFFVWCTAASPSCFSPSATGETHSPRCATQRQCTRYNRHRSIGSDSEGTPYPHQLQPAAVRPRCAACHSDGVIVDQRTIPWTMVFSRRVPGTCLVCGHNLVELVFICRGELDQKIQLPNAGDDAAVPPAAAGAAPRFIVRSVCRSESTSGYNFPLPNVVENITEPLVVSSDTSAADLMQIVFHGCSANQTHRINASGLSRYLAQSRSRRDVIVRNPRMPEVFGAYSIKCCMPQCRGLIYLPTCRLAGAADYDRLREWSTVEQILADGGVLCWLPNHVGMPAFMPPAGEPGPRRHCPTCNDYICEQHRAPWATCDHNLDQNSRFRRQIEAALTEGSIQRCPNPECTEYGQKDGLSTHMRCTNCDQRWCYFCGKPSEGDAHNDNWLTNRERCPSFLDEHPLLDRPSPAESLALFHHFKTLRLLRILRANLETVQPGIFDLIFLQLQRDSPMLLVVETQIEEEGGGRVDQGSAPPITLQLVTQPTTAEQEAQVQYAMP